MAVHNVETKTLFSEATLTSANGMGSGITSKSFETAIILVKATAKVGSTPQLDLDVEVSSDQSSWHKYSDIPQLNDPTMTYYAPAVLVSQLGEYIRVNNPAGMTSGTSMDVEVKIMLKS